MFTIEIIPSGLNATAPTVFLAAGVGLSAIRKPLPIYHHPI